MLALVTCHISPPSIWYGKKMNSWHLTSRLTACSFSEPTASRVRSGRCPRQCATLLHGQMYLQEKTPVLQFGHALEFVPSFPIYGWLTWWCDFFPVGPAFEDHPQVFSQKRSSPLNFIFDTCASASSKSPFFGWWSWTCVVVPFCKDKCIFSKKHMFCNLGAHWHKILEFVPSCPICGWLAWWCDFFPCGANLWRSSASIQSKKVQPLEFYFWHVRLGLLKSPFLVGEAEHMWLYPFCKDKCIFRKKKRLFCNLGALTQNSWIRPIMSYLWMIGLEMRLFSCGPAFEDYPLVFSQKKVQPLGFYFWHLRLGLFKSLFWLVKLNMCVCTLLQGQLYFQQKKHVFCNLGARWHKILEFVPSCPICGMIGLVMRLFFLWGQPLKIIRKYSVKKGPAPWILFLTRAPRPLEVTFFCWWRWTYVVAPFCKVM